MRNADENIKCLLQGLNSPLSMLVMFQAIDTTYTKRLAVMKIRGRAVLLACRNRKKIRISKTGY